MRTLEINAFIVGIGWTRSPGTCGGPQPGCAASELGDGAAVLGLGGELADPGGHGRVDAPESSSVHDAIPPSPADQLRPYGGSDAVVPTPKTARPKIFAHAPPSPP